MLHVFRVIADFMILMDPTRAFVCNLHTSDGMPFLDIAIMQFTAVDIIPHALQEAH